MDLHRSPPLSWHYMFLGTVEGDTCVYVCVFTCQSVIIKVKIKVKFWNGSVWFVLFEWTG